MEGVLDLTNPDHTDLDPNVRCRLYQKKMIFNLSGMSGSGYSGAAGQPGGAHPPHRKHARSSTTEKQSADLQFSEYLAKRILFAI